MACVHLYIRSTCQLVTMVRTSMQREMRILTWNVDEKLRQQEVIHSSKSWIRGGGVWERSISQLCCQRNICNQHELMRHLPQNQKHANKRLFCAQKRYCAIFALLIVWLLLYQQAPRRIKEPHDVVVQCNCKKMSEPADF